MWMGSVDISMRTRLWIVYYKVPFHMIMKNKSETKDCKRSAVWAFTKTVSEDSEWLFEKQLLYKKPHSHCLTPVRHGVLLNTLRTPTSGVFLNGQPSVWSKILNEKAIFLRLFREEPCSRPPLCTVLLGNTFNTSVLYIHRKPGFRADLWIIIRIITSSMRWAAINSKCQETKVNTKTTSITLNT